MSFTHHRMTKTLHTLESIAMGVCISYVLISWYADLAEVGNIHPGLRYRLLFSAGLATTLVGFFCSLMAHRRRPALARFTMAACLLWMVWALWPRL
jgi:hypothetical protein